MLWSGSFPRPRGRSVAAVIAALAVAAPAAASEAAPRELPARLAEALAVPHVRPAGTAALAVDLGTYEVVYARRPSLALAPASTEKLALSYGLLVRLGPLHRLHTEVLGAGGPEGPVWQGHLVLRGRGDPSLTSDGLRQLAKAVRARGIRRVTGGIVADESFFDARRTAPGWKASYYIDESPPLSALVVDRARVGRRTAREPALAAAGAFRRALAAAGVRVDGAVAAGRATGDEELLARRASPPLLKLLRRVNRSSDNFTAEMLLKHLGATVRGRGTTAAGAAVVRAALVEGGIPVEGVRFVDGSGLSLLDRLTADALVGILLAAWDDPLLRGHFLSSLAVAGRSGTLKRRLRAPTVLGRVFAKTGTTARASTLAGYVDGRFAFAVLQNGSPISGWWARVAQDRFVTALATAP